ncbi:hypothetical protein [Empedobacter brevis]|uniref:hypothetical protein n=1 Tax=Empedobacter brevis TaxID=247 RepID=UPI0003A43C2F|nr:hypothetical protein [Empedobacter brevis]
MRTLLHHLVLPLLLCTGVAWGQEQVEIKEKGNYYFNNISTNVTKKLNSNAESYNASLKEKIAYLLEGTSYYIKVNKIENDTVFFTFGLFKKEDEERLINNHQLKEIDSAHVKSNDSSNPSNKRQKIKNIQYSLPKDVFSTNVSILYNRIEYRVGVYTIPFKLRFSSFSFDANVNLGANLGAKIRWNRKIENGFALEPILGFGLASIKLDDSNSITQESTNVSAFTINTGLLIHLTGNINLALTYGFDNISQNDQNNYKWKYQGKGWLGIGINVSFNNGSSNTSTLQKQ